MISGSQHNNPDAGCGSPCGCTCLPTPKEPKHATAGRKPVVVWTLAESEQTNLVFADDSERPCICTKGPQRQAPLAWRGAGAAGTMFMPPPMLAEERPDRPRAIDGRW